MVWAVFVDQEAVDLLDASAEMAYAALDARARRVDQDGMIKRSLEMSQIKLQGLRQCFHSNPLIDWSELSASQKAHFLKSVSMITEQEDPRAQDAIFKAIRDVVLSPGLRKPQTKGASPWEDGDLSRSSLEGTPARTTPKPPKVSGLRVKARSRKTPPKAAG